jgi:hypothetical protein
LFRTFAFDCFIIWLEPAETASARSLFPSNRNPLCGRPGQFLKISTSISITYATYTPEIAGIINCYSDRARLLDKEKQRNRWEEVQVFLYGLFSKQGVCQYGTKNRNSEAETNEAKISRRHYTPPSDREDD